ncbi:MAG: hypothetical protein KGL35_29065 [Bradyrhizobium sp.]|nr:hypothetical protein [Bradyrhizobium sp.]
MSPSLNPIFAEALRPFAPASSEVHAIVQAAPAAVPAPVAAQPSPSYFVVMIDLGRYGSEAIVHPEDSRADVLARVIDGNYPLNRLVFIHHVHDGRADDVTGAIVNEAMGVREAA